jgi:hypothetical protein
MNNTYRAHIFKQCQVGLREEVKLRLFTTLGDPIDLCGNDEEDPDIPIPEDLSEHVNSETPHPIYDDGPSLVLLYENAKV